jgi:hypothetical protein
MDALGSADYGVSGVFFSRLLDHYPAAVMKPVLLILLPAWLHASLDGRTSDTIYIASLPQSKAA